MFFLIVKKEEEKETKAFFFIEKYAVVFEINLEKKVKLIQVKISVFSVKVRMVQSEDLVKNSIC
jgi:hypothetical protein